MLFTWVLDFTLQDFDFKVNTLTTAAEIDQLLEEQALQIKGFEVKLGSRELQSDRSEYRSENLDQEITELGAVVTSRETELAALTPGTRARKCIYRLRYGKNPFKTVKFSQIGNANCAFPGR